MSNQTGIDHWVNNLAPTYPTPPLELVSGQGCVVTDAQGHEYLDLLAGIAVNSLGHAHPAVVEAVSHQVNTLGHVSNLFASRPAADLAGKLIERLADYDASVKDTARVFLCNSGTEANEAAFKLARLTGRQRVLCAQHGFHGRTMGALALTGQPSKRAPFEPLPGGVEFFPLGDIDYLRSLVALDPESVAAIMLEPIQGETGVIPAPSGFLAHVRELCDDIGALLIVDEVQTGIGRTGDLWAFQSEDITPDVITLAKGLGGGLPIGACITVTERASLFTVGAHGTTFGGNPIACAAACAVLGEVNDALLEHVRTAGDILRSGIEKLDGVAEVRGRGLMLGVVLDEAIAREVVAAGYEHGLILNATSGQVLRLTPPLIITEAECSEAVARFSQALEAAVSTNGPSQK
ncbi:acetylornithine transaminase [Corynebacterium tapiri]|uniref:Acetylornithine aminotransferase n=1 Tax=Corynebacterium tapiri TaxID=1448266 RepID=A0A5C4U338_9CORY|nr:acetylornithine transaminase [Corynebacterium tapiri]TNL94363.1 acetylornithine transaminase [Corynebacterium tapiri]